MASQRFNVGVSIRYPNPNPKRCWNMFMLARRTAPVCFLPLLHNRHHHAHRTLNTRAEMCRKLAIMCALQYEPTCWSLAVSSNAFNRTLDERLTFLPRQTIPRNSGAAM